MDFFEEFIDEWGTVLYIPTRAGEGLLTVVIAFLLLFAMVGLQLYGHRVSVRKLAFCALTLGIATFLAQINIPIGDAGGNITFFAMLVIILPGYWFGPIAGIATGMAFGVFQILIDPYLIFWIQIAVDYLFAFGVLGIAGFFCKDKYGLLKGYVCAVAGRYFFAVLSGAVFFGDYAWEGWAPLTYSLAYNAIYLLPEAGMTLVLLCIPRFRQLMASLKDFITEKKRLNESFAIKPGEETNA